MSAYLLLPASLAAPPSSHSRVGAFITKRLTSRTCGGSAGLMPLMLTLEHTESGRNFLTEHRVLEIFELSRTRPAQLLFEHCILQ